MKYSAAMVMASAAAVSADCSITSFLENGNWYCEAVQLISYTGLDTSGSYKAVSNMDTTTGDCSFESQAYSGSIAPFNEELSVHIRGPTQLKQFAVYTPNTASTKKRQEHKSHVHKRHGHQHLHKKHTEAQKEEARAVGDVVTAVIDGQTVSWVNTYSGESDDSADSASAATTTAAATSTTSKAKSSKTSATSTGTAAAATGDYQRIAYYNAEEGTADGVTFVGAWGGVAGSGTWDTKFGNSLSYLSADGTTGAESSTVLDNVLVGDNIEYAIFSDVECTADDADCGYYRPDSVAYQGFGGADKVFLFEFTMPLSGSSEGTNPDMPAIWLLNGKIPRTQQYGDCSCWATDSDSDGCGEADLFEVLSQGDTKAKSTFHFLNSLGSSDYFDRPTEDYIKIAAVFRASDSTASIKVLDSSVDFSSSLTSDVVDGFITETDSVLSAVMDFLSSLK
ncbi:putative TOS1-like glycosyl hydrolase-domain-containing protein [Pestalotiopsis sp. NC0098]|nr:putative TOS1-like glycosyl hydrolase-domain-containing protein [Pestalotiopsis sp. NC0098]